MTLKGFLAKYEPSAPFTSSAFVVALHKKNNK